MNNKNTDRKAEVRALRDGEWYWIQKAVIRDYAKKIGTPGIAVYDLLASLADRNQSCFPSQKYIAQTLGCSRTTVHKSLGLLEENGLIEVQKRTRYHCVYRLLKVRCKADERQMSTQRASDVHQMDTNKNTLTRINTNTVIDDKKFNCSFYEPHKRFVPKTKKELLASDLAVALNDRKGLSRYLSLAGRHPEGFLRRTLSEAKEICDSKIKTSRAALFNHLIKKYEKNNNRPGDQSGDKAFGPGLVPGRGIKGMGHQGIQREMVKRKDEEDTQNDFPSRRSA